MPLMLMRPVLAITLLLAACGSGQSTPLVVPTNSSVVALPATTPAPLPRVTVTVPRTTQAPQTTTTEPLVNYDLAMTPGERSCPGWLPVARKVGWPEDQLEKLSFVMWRESRCNPLSHNPTDPVSGSRGLTQINGYWCRPSKWSQAGWLQDRGVLATCDDLFDPEVNLRAALFVWYYGVEKGRSGWGPWSV